MAHTESVSAYEGDEELVLYASEAEAVVSGEDRVWRILIVDDDEDVHRTTVFSLGSEVILGRRLAFLHAYSATEAETLLAVEHDVAVVLLDVVMESEHAGLDLVRRLRENLGLRALRIILRTGQPGYAPETEAIRDYDINDYKTKSELTKARLYVSLTAALRSYDQTLKLEAGRRGLAQIVAASSRLNEESGLQAFAEGVIVQLAALLDVAPEGLVCVQERPEASGRYQVLAATGRYLPCLQGSLDALVDADAGAELRLALARREHVFGSRSVTLYFPCRNGRHLAVHLDSPRLPDPVAAHLLRVFASHIATCADNVQLIARLNDFAFVDQQLGLPNRQAFIQALDRHVAAPADEPCAVLLIDIDQFAETNETFGHAYGDALLIELAIRLRPLQHAGCTVARVAGDSFAVLGRVGLAAPALVRALLAQPFTQCGGEHVLSTSMAVVLLDHREDGQTILKNASIALKLAKAQGPGHDFEYNAGVGVETRARMHLLHDLHSAFEHDRLFMVYQPQIDLASGRVLAVEALMRWRGENGVFIAPDHFIPIAEHSGLIVALGTWALRTALNTLKTVQAQGFPELRMAVNISALQFHAPDFLDTVTQALASSALAPQCLELEITESVAMTGERLMGGLLERLRALGITIAIDDFGTGFSSLSYLEQLPVDRLKIDRSFVLSLDDRRSGRITEMIMDLGRHLQMRVIAEGVEDVRQARRLTELGCHEVQGYLYARPMPGPELGAWLMRTGGRVVVPDPA